MLNYSPTRFNAHTWCICVFFLWYAHALPVVDWARSAMCELRPSEKYPQPRQISGEVSLPKTLFTNQFSNPSEIISVLLLLGGDVVHKAIAQDTKHAKWNRSWYKPAVFSFGWVSYAFNAVSCAFGGGSFMPVPDCPGLVLNISSGDVRENRSWVIGRLIRDLELKVEKDAKRAAEGERLRAIEKEKKSAEDQFNEINLGPEALKKARQQARKIEDKHARRSIGKPDPLDTPLLVSVFQAMPQDIGKEARIWWLFTLVVMVIQLGVAAIPWALYRNWSIFAVTAIGDLLATCTASCLGSTKDKYACRHGSKSSYALTRGNGHKHVFIILPDRRDERSNLPYLDDMASLTSRPEHWRRWASGIIALLWIMLLITIGGLKEHTWFLFGVGTVGMVHNVVVAGWQRSPASHGISLVKRRTADRHQQQFGKPRKDGKAKLRNTLIELERHYAGAGLALRGHFLNVFETTEDKEEWSKVEVAKESREGRVWLWRWATYGINQETLLPASRAGRKVAKMLARVRPDDQPTSDLPTSGPMIPPSLMNPRVEKALETLKTFPPQPTTADSTTAATPFTTTMHMLLAELERDDSESTQDGEAEIRASQNP